MKEGIKKDGQDMTFHVCLLQVLQDKTNDMSKDNQFFVHSVKQMGGRFIKEIDRKLNVIYGGCDRTEVDQGMDLIKLITKKVDEAHEEYLENLKQGKI